MHRASGPDTMGWFCHSFPVKPISASSTVSCYDSPVTPEIKILPVRISMASGYIVCCCQLKPHILVVLMCHATTSTWSNRSIIPLLHLARGWACLVLVMVLVARSLEIWLGDPFKSIGHNIIPSILPWGLPTEKWSSIYLQRVSCGSHASSQLTYPCW